jgi:hypothetical protein
MHSVVEKAGDTAKKRKTKQIKQGIIFLVAMTFCLLPNQSKDLHQPARE